MTRILVADDSETILLLLRTRLEMEGYDVTTAVDGEEAMQKLGGEPGSEPDVILLDAMMPRKSGLDVLRELRAGGSRTPILIVSAHQEQEAIGDVSGHGADGYIRKPIDFDELLGHIRQLAPD
ncbi:MAG TPA: response regulator transcription factor [Solirubrobacterales bacterium]|nr:response regulator transcription factor [Solirubrobacterales bacterium]